MSRVSDDIKDIYGEAGKDVLAKLSEFLSTYAKEDAEWAAKLAAGTVKPSAYKAWRTATILRAHGFTQLIATIAARITDADDAAAAYTAGQLPGAFTSAAMTQQRALSFGVFNEQAVARLITQQPDILPPSRVNIPKALRWNMNRVRKEITKSIIAGDSIPKIADRLQAVTTMNRNAAVRNARTAMAGATNAGRQSIAEEAIRRGIKVQKRWVATSGNRTRDSHRRLHGKTVDVDKPFPNGLMYPGDPKGKPEEVYNCRCSIAYKRG